MAERGIRNMKGVILAGGLATRLRPLTQVTNKHLLPVFNKPMIFYPLEAMQQAGIKEVLLTSSPDHSGHFANLLGSGEEFNLRLYYAIQKNQKGAMVFGIKINTDSKQYGVIEIEKNGKVISIEEKPETPKSNIAQTGIY